MKNRIAVFAIFSLLFASCEQPQADKTESNKEVEAMVPTFKSGYSEVNGMQMYYEIHGAGKPLVLIHGGGSTIGSSFGRIIPLLAQSRQVIAVELQAHGRTADRPADLSFEQDADDVVSLLGNLGIQKADFFGFSNGATTTLQIVIRHPERVNKIILGSPLAKRSGVPSQFWDFMTHASLDNMPKQLQTAYLEVNPDSQGLQIMHDKDAKRMVNFKDIADEEISSIQAPALIINGDMDVITLDHVNELNRLIPNSELLIITGAHGAYIGEITTLEPGHDSGDFVVPQITEFLNRI